MGLYVFMRDGRCVSEQACLCECLNTPLRERRGVRDHERGIVRRCNGGARACMCACIYAGMHPKKRGENAKQKNEACIMHACVDVHMHAHVPCACMYPCQCIYVYPCACMYPCAYAYMYPGTYACI